MLDKPTVLVFNKVDLFRQQHYDNYLEEEVKAEIEDGLKSNLRHTFEQDLIFVSAHTKEGINELRKKLKQMVYEQYMVRYPYQAKRW